MVMLHTPEAPASSKQLWLLHILTHEDTRDLKITMRDASNRIAALKNGAGKGEAISRPMVNPHASYVQQDRQKLSQARFDKAHPQPEISFTQGSMPQGQTDMAKIEAHFKLNAYQLGRDKAGNDTADIGFYDFQCKTCLFGLTGVCEPSWESAGFVTCANHIESVSFDCKHYEPLKYDISQYCYRPKGSQCHRKNIDNKCLECASRKNNFRLDYGSNRTAHATYIPTISERIASQARTRDLYTNPSRHFSDLDYTEAIKTIDEIINLIKKIEGI